MYQHFKIERYPEQLDPQLIEFVRTLTNSARGKRSLFEDRAGTAYKRKKIRHLYAISVLLFLTDRTVLAACRFTYQ